MISKLIAEKAVSQDVGYDIRALSVYRNKIAHGEDLSNQERDMLEDMIYNLKASEELLNKDFIIYTVRQYFTSKKFNIARLPDTDEFDLIVSENNNVKKKIYFEIKNIIGSPYNLYNKFISNNNEIINDKENGENKYVLMNFSESSLDSKKNMDDFYYKNRNLSDRYFIFTFTKFDMKFAYECYDKVLELE